MIQYRKTVLALSIVIHTLNLQASYCNESIQEIKENFKKGCLRNDSYIIMEALSDLKALKISKKACRMLNFDMSSSKQSRRINYDILTEMQDKDGNTVLYNAVRDNHINVARILLQFGANPTNALIDQLSSVEPKMENMLIDAGAKPRVTKRKIDEL